MPAVDSPASCWTEPNATVWWRNTVAFVVDVGDRAVINVDGWAHGGEGVGRLEDGRACFVAGAIPGEVVEVEITKDQKRFAHAETVDVQVPSPHRVEPPCPYFGVCGGCQLQHISPSHQIELKYRVLREQLQRIGKQPDPPVTEVRTPKGGWPEKYRAWARMAADEKGRLGFRRARSHEIEPIDHCLLLTDETQAVLDRAGSDHAPGREVTIAASEHMQVHGARFHASPGAFFQAGPAAAEALVTAVLEAVGDIANKRVLDLYCGGGLLAWFLAANGASVIAVEADPTAVADARRNLSSQDVEVVQGRVEDVLPTLDADVVVLDPPRAGAKAAVCEKVAALGPEIIVYVGCDAAALARDVATLAASGYVLDNVVGLDLFGHTSHVEAVARLHPAASASSGGGVNRARGPTL